MTALEKAREYVLRSKNPDRVLHLADMYLDDMTKKGPDFVLPAAHAYVKPFLEFYYGDLPGWTSFVKGVRDEYVPSSMEYKTLHALFRTIDLRRIQQERRARLGKAVAFAVKKKLIEDSPSVKKAYADKCTRYWQSRRNNLLSAARKDSDNGRVALDERERLLEEFWALIDHEVENGELPKP